jgi:hypothetical protein
MASDNHRDDFASRKTEPKSEVVSLRLPAKDNERAKILANYYFDIGKIARPSVADMTKMFVSIMLDAKWYQIEQYSKFRAHQDEHGPAGGAPT